MSQRLFVATRKGLFTLERTGRGDSGWSITSTAFLGDNCSMVLPDATTGRVYAGLSHGHFGCKLHRSDDRGATWREVAAPAYPPMPDGWAELADAWHVKPIPWNLELIWSLESAGPDEPEGLWCGTIPGGLFRSRDAGASWTLMRSLWQREERRRWFGGGFDYPGIHSICVDPRDARRVAVGVSCGGVWETRDGGETWSCRADGMRAAYLPPEQAHDPHLQDPHRMVQCPTRPDVFWVQHHNGVFCSGDDLKSWREIENVPPSPFGFAVAVHPRDADTAWFVPAIKDEKRIPVDGRVVVTRTHDGGRTFQELRRGLPQEHAYDLVFRHALDVDSSGDVLAFGSTTGSLWVSEDQGDEWRSITEHLPPVFVVRFESP